MTQTDAAHDLYRGAKRTHIPSEATYKISVSTFKRRVIYTTELFSSFVTFFLYYSKTISDHGMWELKKKGLYLIQSKNNHFVDVCNHKLCKRKKYKWIDNFLSPPSTPWLGKWRNSFPCCAGNGPFLVNAHCGNRYNIDNGIPLSTYIKSQCMVYRTNWFSVVFDGSTVA